MTAESNPAETPPKVNPLIARLDAARVISQAERDAGWKGAHVSAMKYSGIAEQLLKGGKEEEAKAEFVKAAEAEEQAFHLLTMTQPSNLHSQAGLGENVARFSIKGGNYQKADEAIGEVLSFINPQDNPDHFQIAIGIRSVVQRYLTSSQ